MKKLLLILLLLPIFVKGQTITTYVGNGIGGPSLMDGGPATSAQLAMVAGLNFDNNGNLLICQQDVVRRVDKLTDTINVIAGSDTATSAGGGGDGGPATCAAIIAPFGVCVDKVGNLYIADNWYSEIRKVTIATGIIDTFAGDRTPGNTGNGGPAKQATLGDPCGVCFDTAQRYLYIANTYGRDVRRVDMLNDTIGAFAGTGIIGFSGDGGPAVSATFSRILGMCMDVNDNLYIGDWDNARIRRVDAITGIVTTICGNGTIGFSGDGGPATNAIISKPTGICFDKCGNLYFSDEDSNHVRRIDITTGIINTIAGNGIAGYSGDGGPALNAQFNHPTGIAIDSMGNLYVGDYYNNRVRKIAPFAPPFVSIASATTNTICVGYPITIQTTTAVAGSTPSFQWSVNGSVISATSSSYTYIPANGDSVSCILTSSSACVGTPTVVSNTVHIVVNPLTVPTMFLTGISAASIGALVTLTATVTNAGSSYDIKWFDNGLLFSTTTTPTVTYTKATGTDTITARVIPTGIGCYDSTTSAAHIVTDTSTSVNIISGQHLQMYPNPANDVLHVTGTNITSIAITNLIGQVLYTHEYNSQQVQVSVADLPAGMYLVRINGSEVRKFVKE